MPYRLTLTNEETGKQSDVYLSQKDVKALIQTSAPQRVPIGIDEMGKLAALLIALWRQAG